MAGATRKMVHGARGKRWSELQTNTKSAMADRVKEAIVYYLNTL